jgi:hypothetical protein
MKSPGAWFESSMVAAGLMVGMLVVMWAQRPDASCTLAPEASRRLVLTRETDREHLASDLASVTRIASRYSASTPSDGQQHGRLRSCEALLIQEIATRHHVPRNDLRASAQ